MNIGLDTRKPVDQLDATDLSTFPVWEFALDEEDVDDRDETWVRPIDTQVVPGDRSSLVVAATFTTACTQEYSGFVIITTASQALEMHGGVVLNGHDYIPMESREELTTSLGLSETDLFPMTYVLHVPVQGELSCRSGTWT